MQEEDDDPLAAEVAIDPPLHLVEVPQEYIGQDAAGADARITTLADVNLVDGFMLCVSTFRFADDVPLSNDVLFTLGVKHVVYDLKYFYALLKERWDEGVIIAPPQDGTPQYRQWCSHIGISARAACNKLFKEVTDIHNVRTQERLSINSKCRLTAISPTVSVCVKIMREHINVEKSKRN
jgi:hypothetical protein